MSQHYRYLVQGRGEFPMDMLRYDEARPFHGLSEREETRVVTVIGRRRPTNARWESFGWRVLDTKIEVLAGELPDAAPPNADVPQTAVESW